MRPMYDMLSCTYCRKLICTLVPSPWSSFYTPFSPPKFIVSVSWHDLVAMTTRSTVNSPNLPNKPVTATQSFHQSTQAQIILILQKSRVTIPYCVRLYILYSTTDLFWYFLKISSRQKKKQSSEVLTKSSRRRFCRTTMQCCFLVSHMYTR